MAERIATVQQEDGRLDDGCGDWSPATFWRCAECQIIQAKPGACQTCNATPVMYKRAPLLDEEDVGGVLRKKIMLRHVIRQLDASMISMGYTLDGDFSVEAYGNMKSTMSMHMQWVDLAMDDMLGALAVSQCTDIGDV